MTKLYISVILFFGFILTLSGQTTDTTTTYTVGDSLEDALQYQTGTIELKNGLGTVRIPPGFQFLNGTDSRMVLRDFWGNPDDVSVLGMIIPAGKGVVRDDSWAFIVTYDEIGFVEDDDAEDIDYEELLEIMKEEMVEGNEERVKAGYEKIGLIGWATPPSYNADKKILFWAKELKFGDAPENTLNYNVRILGRKGVLVLNAVGNMSQFKEINAQVPKVLDIVTFKKGNTYADFNPDVDEVAAWTIGGLVAGKVLAKVGILAFFGKFLKVIIVAIVAGAGALWKWIKGRKEES